MNLILRNVKTIIQAGRYKAQLARAERLLKSCEDTAAPPPAPDLPERIREFLASDSWEVRNCAVKIIARAHLAELYPALVRALTDPAEAGIVRRNCAELLPDIPLAAPEALHALRLALRDPYWEVRAESARALSLLAPPAPDLEAELLRRLDAEEDTEARAALAQALGGLGSSREAFNALLALAASGPWLVRCQAAVGMTELAARRPEFTLDATDALRQLDLLAEGAATASVFQQRILELIDLTTDTSGGNLEPREPFPAPETLRRRYLHLKHGWLR